MVNDVFSKLRKAFKELYGIEPNILFDKEEVVAHIPLHKFKALSGKECDDIVKEVSNKVNMNFVHNNCFMQITLDVFRGLEVELPKHYEGIKAIVEFSSPNIAKPFNVGHLRSTILGNALSLLLQKSGAEVVKINYLGDWGVQFGKLIVAWKRYGNKEELKRRGIRYLFDLYVRIHKEEEKDGSIKEGAEREFIRLENGDEENRKLWEMFRDISIKEFQVIYDMLDVKFDIVDGESKNVDGSSKLIEELLSKGVAFVDEDKSVVCKTPYGNVVINKRGERTLYSTRDLVALKKRCKEHKPDMMFYVVGSEQKQYFQQIFYVASHADLCNASLEHIDFGLLYLPEGKFSTRKGNVVFVDEFLHFLKEHIKSSSEERGKHYSDKTIHEIALNTLKFAILSQSRRKNFKFDVKKFTSYNNENAIYLLYTYARAKSVIKEYRSFKADKEKAMEQIKRNENALKVANYVLKLPLFFEKALQNRDPHYLAVYLLELSKKYNSLYQSTRFIGNKDFEHAGHVLSTSLLYLFDNVFSILSMKAVEGL